VARFSSFPGFAEATRKAYSVKTVDFPEIVTKLMEPLDDPEMASKMRCLREYLLGSVMLRIE
jgi:hypothetical protein